MKKVLFWFYVFLFTGHLFSLEGKNILRIGIPTFPVSLNPVYVTDETSQAVINKVFDSLFYFDEQGKIGNCLVEDYSYHDGGQEIMVNLKKDRFFSDGKQLTSDDVLATFDILRNSKIKYPYQSMLSFIHMMKKIDTFRFSIRLNHKLAIWKNQLCFKILNSREIQSIDLERFKYLVLSGTGPYKIESVREPARIVLIRNVYNQTRALFTGIDYIVVTSTQMEPLKLVNHEIDICELQPEDVEAYGKIPEWQHHFNILKYKKFGLTYLVFNLNNSLVDRNVRRIFYNQLVKGDFVDRFIRNRGEKIKTPFLLFNRDEQPSSLPEIPLNKPIKLKILTNSESKLRKEFVLFLKQALQSKNIHLDPLFLEYQTFLGYLKKGHFDLAVSGFILDIDYDMKDVFYHDSYFNYAGFKNRRMDELLDRGLKELNPLKRRQIYQQANLIWKDQLPLIPLFNLYYHIGVSKRITIPERVCTLVGSTSDFLINIQDWKVR
ncbi:MAG: ABC transporter substrate-binding protein [Candidatus Aminicenantes bacterium]|nr:ABC transporter substrate-binding protein [Candidatus Aminicenantes bacterium]